MIEFDQIVLGCKRYNKIAQKTLYEMYAPKMKGICFRYLGDPETTKDVVQEGFIKVFSNINQFKEKGSFEGWMKRIFINTAISYLRKQAKENKHLSFDELYESDVEEDNTLSIDKQLDMNKPTTHSNLEDKDLIELADLSESELLITLQSIPEKYRTVFNLFCIEHFKHDEIAEILNIDKTTSRTRLSRARNLIQRELLAFCHKKITESTYEKQ